MSKELTVTTSNEYQTYLAEIKKEICALDWNDIKKTYAPTATDKEFAIYLDTCQANVLDPRKKEAYFVKYGTAPGQTITGYNVYIKRADRTGKLNGWDVRLTKKDGKPISATITIYRKDFDKPFVWEVDAEEFHKGQSTWNTMPGFMLKKVAIAQGFRLAFPDEMGGLPYTSEELSTFADDNTSRQALDATNSTKTRTIDVTPEVEAKPVAAKPVAKAKPKLKPVAKPAPVQEEKPEQEESAEEEEDNTETEEAEETEVEEVDEGTEEEFVTLSEATKATILNTLGGFAIKRELMESVLGAKYEDWHEGHRLWLIERYHECNSGDLDAKGFAGLTYS